MNETSMIPYDRNHVTYYQVLFNKDRTDNEQIARDEIAIKTLNFLKENSQSEKLIDFRAKKYRQHIHNHWFDQGKTKHQIDILINGSLETHVLPELGRKLELSEFRFACFIYQPVYMSISSMPRCSSEPTKLEPIKNFPIPRMSIGPITAMSKSSLRHICESRKVHRWFQECGVMLTKNATYQITFRSEARVYCVGEFQASNPMSDKIYCFYLCLKVIQKSQKIKVPKFLVREILFYVFNEVIESNQVESYRNSFFC